VLELIVGQLLFGIRGKISMGWRRDLDCYEKRGINIEDTEFGREEGPEKRALLRRRPLQR